MTTVFEVELRILLRLCYIELLCVCVYYCIHTTYLFHYVLQNVVFYCSYQIWCCIHLLNRNTCRLFCSNAKSYCVNDWINESITIVVAAQWRNIYITMFYIKYNYLYDIYNKVMSFETSSCFMLQMCLHNLFVSNKSTHLVVVGFNVSFVGLTQRVILNVKLY